jgi:hypothetical protein
MALESFRESLRLLGRMPLLWVPGILAGIFAAGLWLLLNATGPFFTSRLMVITTLILLVFVVGALVLIRDGSGDIQAMIHGGVKYYFRVLLPLLVICFTLVIIFFLLIVTFGLTGTTPDPEMVGLLTFCVMIPTLMLGFFFDMAAVFEDKKVFESIQRSILLVSTNMMEVISFYIISALAGFSIIFALMITWEIALYDKLEPLTRYNETQMQAITPEQLMGMIGPDGIWVTAVVLFIGCLVLLPLFISYKACFFKKLISGSVTIQQVTGEYDSKGRWYKY